MRQSSSPAPFVDDSQNLESIEEMEATVSNKSVKGSEMSNVAHLNQASSGNLQLEGIDLCSDGKLKICFSQGVELLVDPNSKNLQGRGMNLRIGNVVTQVTRNADGIQLNVDGFVINLKR